MKRDVASLETRVFDLLVIGGGVVGACVAWDAALRGLAVALVERDDFGAGTSANSLKIVHGGLRYLQHADVRRVRESIRERSTWLRLAPHLVQPLPIVVPTRGHGLEGRGLLRTALALADAIGFDRNVGLAPESRLPAGRSLTRSECIGVAPELEAWPFTGGVLFHDAQLYSAERLVLGVVAAAAAAGACVANHVECESPLRRVDGVLRFRLRDRLSGGRLELRARTAVNATGPAAPLFGGALVRAPAPAVAYSVALNLMVPRLSHAAAFTAPAASRDPSALVTRGRRQLFVVPWRERTLIGTAHYALDRERGATISAERHASRFLEEINSAWPGRRFEPDDVALVHHGYLPVVSTPDGEGLNLLKRHRILDHARDGAPELFTVVSTKLTTARLVAEETVDRVCGRLRAAVGPCRTAETPLPGAPASGFAALRSAALRRHADVVEPDVLEHLLHCYGSTYEEVIAYRSELADWNERVVASAPVIRAQLLHAIRSEMACRAEDIIDRRTEIRAIGARSPAALAQATRLLQGARAGRPVPVA